MKLYLDTEFNGHGGELISMALVGEGHCWYAVREMTQCVDKWVAEHVIPKLSRPPMSRELFHELFRAFITRFDNPEIICDWHADAMHFSAMLSGPDFGSSLDFPYRVTVLKTPPGQPVSKNPHNAYDDAVALMEWHQSVGGK